MLPTKGWTIGDLEALLLEEWFTADRGLMPSPVIDVDRELHPTQEIPLRYVLLVPGEAGEEILIVCLKGWLPGLTTPIRFFAVMPESAIFHVVIEADVISNSFNHLESETFMAT